MPSPQEPGAVQLTQGEILEELQAEADRLIRWARTALDRAEEEIVRLRVELELAAEGQPYRRVAGAGTGTAHQARGLDIAVIAAAFDAIERVAQLKPTTQEET